MWQTLPDVCGLHENAIFNLQAGPALPSTESPVAAAGPKFPSRDGSETRTGEDFFGALPGVEAGAVEQGEEASSSGPALQAPSGQCTCTPAFAQTLNHRHLHFTRMKA